MLITAVGRHRESLVAALAILACLVLVLPSPTSAQSPNYVSGNACAGNLTPRWQSGDTWIMYGNVTVPANCVLTIEPGAIVRADRAVRLYINGQLQANGTSTSSITFSVNRTGEVWSGIQFNKTSRASYLQFASLDTMDVGVQLVQNPLFAGPTIMNNNIDHAVVGVVLQGSSGTVWGNRINDTAMGIQATTGGSPTLVANVITSVRGSPAVGIYATNLDTPDIASNTVRWVNGTAGTNGAVAGQRGQDGGAAIGILANGSVYAIVAGNTVDQVRGGRGGDGAANPLGNGGHGGLGGPAAGIALSFSGTSRVQGGRITSVYGGHGGNGGTGTGATASGGDGGAGGGAIALESYNDTTQGWWFYNTAKTLIAGYGGDGGSGNSGAGTGRGGNGGDANAFFLIQSANANASNDGVQSSVGGNGGNGSVGGSGGQAAGLWLFGFGGAAILGNNTVTTMTGGNGGAGSLRAGVGGNASGLFVYDSGTGFAPATIANTNVTGLTGGAGGLGLLAGGAGGAASGIVAYHAKLLSLSNRAQSILGGQGGSTAPTQVMGQSGTAAGLATVLVSSSSSLLDSIQSVTRGPPAGTGQPAPPAYGVGLFNLGVAGTPSTVSMANATFGGIGDYELYLDNYTSTITLNTTLTPSKLRVQPKANLTVQNFLAVKAFWPNNITPVLRVVVTIHDGAATVFNRTVLSGSVRWIPVTNRVYLGSPIPVWNETQASVSFGTYTFSKNPRTVNMTVSQTQVFAMMDAVAPVSAASPLPAWTGTRSFTVHFTYSDGNGTGVANVTLWYNLNRTAWVVYGIQAVGASGSGAFAFTAPADGNYQFATTAYDGAGNHQPAPPAANNTWTIVDTRIPVSMVTALPTWETSLSFPVSWAPSPGETDIAFYVVQYFHAGSWVTWLGDTAATSATFDITALGIPSTQGVYAFRTLAHSFAGLVETKTGNDTWTTVDTIAPSSTVAGLSRYMASASFAISWAASAGTTDAATYAIQVSTDGGSWSSWFSGATNGSATFTGTDGHRYAFRSLATDLAGNVESKTGNDSWTLIDLTPPSTLVTPLPAYEDVAAFTVSWGPLSGTTDVASYAIQVSSNGGPWTTWFSGATNRSATFTGRDGHGYAFRSLATDNAGNVESKSGNDTSTIVDTTAPYVVSDVPEGAGVNTTLTVVITFSEPMNQASAQQAFAISPAINGAFSWSSSGSVMTFTPSRSLQPGTVYVVNLDTRATDLAGNPLPAPTSFNFTTLGSAGGTGGALAIDPLWLALIAVVVAGAAVAFVLLRRRSAGETVPAETPKAAAPTASSRTEIDDVFLLYKDGILIKHETLRLRPDVDTDILSGMLTAVQQFVKDSFQSEDEGELNEITVGQMHLHIGRGKWLILAARVAGGDVATMNEQITASIKDMEDHHWDQLEDWDGDMALAKVLGPYLKKLIRGDYA